MKNAYTFLGWLAMVLTPVGAVIFFGWRVYTAVNAETGTAWLAIPAGIAAAVGLEMVGIFAGHMSMELWQRKDGRAWLAVGIMAVYVAIGVVELRGTIGMVMFLIAPLVYVLVGLRQSVDEEKGKETAVSSKRLDFQLEQAARDKELERELKAQQQADETAVRMARAEHNAGLKLAREQTKQMKLARVQSEPAESGHEPAQSAHVCQQCEREFASVQALNAHMRFCKAAVPVTSSNGANHA